MNNRKHLDMKYNTIHIATRLAGFIFLVFIMASCMHGNNDTGYVYMPDMAYSQAYETYSPNPNMPLGITSQPPVDGTIPRGIIPYQYQKTFDDQLRAGMELFSPVEMNAENLSRGKAEYDIFCAMCHGVSGKGDGHLFTSNLFTAKPRDLTSDFVQSKPDGELYHVITMGSLSTLMGPHASQIKPDDRWKIILYMRNGFKTN